MPQDPITSLIESCEARLHGYWGELETTHFTNFGRVLDGFLDHGLSEEHFLSVTGYGHHDTGRDVTDAIFAHALQSEAAIARLQLVSGSHAIYCGLKGCLQPGDHLVSVTGAPYDTLEEMIGIRGNSRQSFQKMGITYSQLDCFARPEWERLDWTEAEHLEIGRANTIFIQRSRGYGMRPTLTIEQLADLIASLRQINPGLTIMVDNCFGEFVFDREPTAVGADLIAGSLIKNPGGGIVPTGGYIAGRQDLVESAAEALTAPGIGADGGYTFDATRNILQGLFLAPNVVKEALKSMSLFAAVFQELGFYVGPEAYSRQADIIQVIHLESAERLLSFCKTLQSVSPVGAKLTPIPAVTPGYQDPVIMAGGTFIFGSTIELSADAPMRPPYAVFVQGGLTYGHARYALGKVLENMDEAVFRSMAVGVPS